MKLIPYKKFVLIFLGILLICFTGCGNNAASKSGTYYKTANDTEFIIVQDNDYYILTYSDKLNTEGLNNGDKIRIVYGDIREIYPPVMNILSIEKIEEGNKENISGEFLEEIKNLNFE